MQRAAVTGSGYEAASGTAAKVERDGGSGWLDFLCGGFAGLHARGGKRWSEMTTRVLERESAQGQKKKKIPLQGGQN